MSNNQNEKQISRKDFLKGVGTTIAGVTLLGGVSGILTACSEKEASADLSKAPQWPFKYEKLDAEKAAKRAYDAYKTGAG